jgi:hypothetical protein
MRLIRWTWTPCQWIVNWTIHWIVNQGNHLLLVCISGLIPEIQDQGCVRTLTTPDSILVHLGAYDWCRTRLWSRCHQLSADLQRNCFFKRHCLSGVGCKRPPAA